MVQLLNEFQRPSQYIIMTLDHILKWPLIIHLGAKVLFSLWQVTNEVFRHAKLTGAGYINKPKMRDYVHCYALHCLDVEQSNQLRKVYKDRGENVGAWCQACYYPLVSLARENEWDIDDLFNRNEKLRIWYVPTKLRQLCHIERIKHGE